MPKLFNVVFDCADAYALASFWSAVMQVPLDEELDPDDDETWVEMPEGPNLYFQEVPEPKLVKNRMHVCLSPDTARDLDVERLIGLGATVVADRREPDGRGWVVLADPEGNEFCVLRSASERAAARAAEQQAAGLAPGAARSVPVQAGSPQAGSAQTGSPRTESSQTESSQTESPQTESPRSGSASSVQVPSPSAPVDDAGPADRSRPTDGPGPMDVTATAHLPGHTHVPGHTHLPRHTHVPGHASSDGLAPSAGLAPPAGGAGPDGRNL